jgi:glutamate dehydrogenase (NAD(P)+)
VLGRQTGGAKGAVRGKPEEKQEIMRRYCEEVLPLSRSGKFLTGADLGTSYDDFAPLRNPHEPPHVMGTAVNGTPLEDLVTGLGVVAGMEAAIGPLDGLTIALEGFGKVGGGVAREAVRRGAKIIAVSTIDGCVHDPKGLDVELMLTLRSAHGDAFVHHMRAEVSKDPRALFATQADILVPGARTGVISREIAEKLNVRWLAPAANTPYTKEGIEVLKQRGIRYLPDFVLNAGAVVGFVCGESTAAGVLKEAERVVSGLMTEASVDPAGPYDGACRMAERFLATWRPPNGMPHGPPLA